MRMAVNMEKKWGDYKIERYSISVYRDSKEVWFSIDNHAENPVQKGGFCSVPVDVANKLGQALLLLSCNNPAGLPDGITFKIDETTQGSS